MIFKTQHEENILIQRSNYIWRDLNIW